MVRRLILGCGSLGGGLVRRLTGRGGTVAVVTDQQGRAEDLRSDGTAAREGDPADPSTYPDEVGPVVVGGEQSPQRNLDVARAARDRYPDTPLVVYLDDDTDPSVRADIYDLADEVIDPRRVVTKRALDTVGTSHTERLNRLIRVLRNVDGRLAVVMYDNPDPGAITAALAFQAITERAGVDADVRYFGDISHQENRTFANLLELDLRILDEVPADDEYVGLTPVDHSRPGISGCLPPETIIGVAIDHHPPRASVGAAYVDLRRGAGTASTLLAEYLERLGIVPDATVATALSFGIQVDTDDFTREVSTADFEAAVFLIPHVDVDLFERVEAPSLTSETMGTLAHVVSDHDVRGNVLTTNVGDIRERDVLAQAADHLPKMEGVEVTIVYGLVDGTVYVSGRAHGARVDLGEAFREALGSIGSIGGHVGMAGAQIPLGILDNVGDDSRESLATIVTDIVAGRVFETLEHAAPTPSLDTDMVFEHPLDE